MFFFGVGIFLRITYRKNRLYTKLYKVGAPKMASIPKVAYPPKLELVSFLKTRYTAL